MKKLQIGTKVLYRGKTYRIDSYLGKIGIHPTYVIERNKGEDLIAVYLQEILLLKGINNSIASMHLLKE